MMLNKNTDKDWKKIGETDPYFGVLTFKEYKSSLLTKETLEKFFLTGEKYVEEIMAIIHDKIDANFIPKQTVDFGCGVGRILIPLSRYSETIIGIDVSAGMVKEAAKNCKQSGIGNYKLILSDGKTIGIDQHFNFFHSFIVFQHIPIMVGMRLFADLINQLEEKGVGVVHFTYYRKASWINQFFYNMIKRSNLFSRVWNILKNRPVSDPVLEMNMYNVNKIFRILQEHGCHNIHVEFTNHGGIYYGILVFFQKAQKILSGVE